MFNSKYSGVLSRSHAKTKKHNTAKSSFILLEFINKWKPNTVLNINHSWICRIYINYNVQHDKKSSKWITYINRTFQMIFWVKHIIHSAYHVDNIQQSPLHHIYLTPQQPLLPEVIKILCKALNMARRLSPATFGYRHCS